MTPSKKKRLKPKEVSSGPSIKVGPPIVELPNDENKLFDEEDDVGTSTIPDLSLPSGDEEEEGKSNNVWEYAIDVLFKLSPLHPQGKSLRKWVKYQDMETMEQFYQWNENDITIGEPHTSYLENSCDKSNLKFIRTNSIRNLHMPWKYSHHFVREAKESSTPGDPYSLCSQTNSVTSPYKSNQNAYQLLAFKKSIKREVSQYTILKDEKYFEALKRNLLVTATTHDCEEIWMEITNLKIMMIVKNSSNRRNASCTQQGTPK